MQDRPDLSGAAVAFTPFELENSCGFIANLDPVFPTRLYGFRQDPISLPNSGTYFGYVQRGVIDLKFDGGGFSLREGMYFCVPGSFRIEPVGSLSLGIVIERVGYKGFFHIGKIEQEGRLKYIDGCTDSLLIPPVRFGDPCLNLLYFPPNIDQTMHVHPSDRVGIILSGEGECITEDATGEHSQPLVAGMAFCIHTNGKHKFRTAGRNMRVLAYHPDSDFGPRDEDHPMINRTIVEGVSASKIEAIHTR